ncbi:MAG: hypothetical protein QNI95_17895 [Desulfobacterales bacterium]|nr:hypothetical protein [Desulfobacterales bacterium]
MQIDQNPLFRKVIAPWYDSEAACFTVAFLMLIVILFAVTGLFVASENEKYHSYLWVPLLLLALSTFVLVSTAVRLIKRYLIRLSG